MPSFSGGLIARDVGVDVTQKLGHRGHGLVDGCELLERAECCKLRDEFSVGLRTGRILVLQLRHEQLQKGVAAERIGPRRGLSGRGWRLCSAAALRGINTHGLLLFRSSFSRTEVSRAGRALSFRVDVPRRDAAATLGRTAVPSLSRGASPSEARSPPDRQPDAVVRDAVDTRLRVLVL